MCCAVLFSRFTLKYTASYPARAHTISKRGKGLLTPSFPLVLSAKHKPKDPVFVSFGINAV